MTDRRVYLIRHAATASNALGYYPPLEEDPTGHLMAHSVESLREEVQELHYGGPQGVSTAIYASTAVRAQLTAQIIAEDLIFHNIMREYDPLLSVGHQELDERSFGDLYGLPKHAAKETLEEKEWAVRTAGDRLRAFVDEVLATTSHELVIFVSHSGPIRGYLSKNSDSLAPSPLNAKLIEVTL